GQREVGVAVHRGGDDDRAATSIAQVRDTVLDGQEGAGQVRLDGGVPLVKGHLVDGRLHAVDAGVGEYDVQATEARDCLGDGRADRLLIGDVGGQRDGLPTSRHNPL